ncbi:uncharacterized protein BO66DRAFT_99378 [Aspergillus aculeatinus CBS 121060]|uniref:Uncharacterized protein n=1 Tax=Aspergillus aculeatinus CBS 121060 TaxID=1448322 RepID=A0ACD1H7M0_9EURO|nr:hypothetical protein BO66DRAFT_99378 [Aspergillus aculeatinus CBS 121060]RAH69629.1 hypothetical protein BO66DRAFT_99378 [Aspergillus aculeatinus CBS 121060]
MGRTRKNNDKEEEEAKKRHIQSLCDACCIRSLKPWIRASLCCADNSFLEALVPTAQMPHEIGPSSDARIYTEEIIKSLAQQSREEPTYQTQEFQGNQCTQKLQTTTKSNDPQQPQTSESTDTTAPGAQRSSEDSGCQTRQLQGDQYTQKLQTTKQSDDSQQPQTSENTNTTAPGDQYSRKKSTVQSQEPQRNRFTQKPQTIKQPSDLQQPPTSKSTVTTAPSQSSPQPQTFESTEVTVPVSLLVLKFPA